MVDNGQSSTIIQMSWAPAEVVTTEALNDWPSLEFNEIGLVTELSYTSPI